MSGGGDQDDLLPGRVNAAFKQEFPDATMKQFRKRTHRDGTVPWEIQFETEDGEARTAEFDTDGKLVQ